MAAVASVSAGGKQTDTVENDSFVPADEGYNLLANPSFEGQYGPYIPPNGHPDCDFGICNTAQMAPGWTPWWVSHNPSDPPWIIRMPEFKPADPMFQNPPRVRSGDAAQQYFTFFSTHEAGFYQQVSVIPGAAYRLGIWGHSWSAQDDDDAYSGPVDGLLDQKVGIDPSGGPDWQASSVVWSPARQQYDFYGWFEVETTAQSPTMTVFIYSRPAFAVKHNDVYWDDAELVLASPSIIPAGGILSLADVAEPRSADYVVKIYWIGDPEIDWLAALDPAGTLNPVLSSLSGPAGEDLIVTIDSTGLALGTYSTTLTLTADPLVPGSPHVMPIQLVVVDELFQAFLPITLRP